MSVTPNDDPDTRSEASSLSTHTRNAQRVPALVFIGDAGQARLRPRPRFATFTRSLFLGRRSPPVRLPETTICVVRDPWLSSRHAQIDQTADGSYELRDLGSTNGTLLDGVSVLRPVPLRDGAVIFFGQHAAVFRILADNDLVAMGRELMSPFGPAPTISPGFLSIVDKLRRLAIGNGEILLVGETGVGKEVYARAVHRRSGRPGPFVPVNCAAIPRELVESELFGYSRGAHSEARDTKVGLLEEADGGTLFLDEIGEMSPELQAKLLRFAQDRSVVPVGSVRPRRLDVRILAATNRMVQAVSASGGGLRPDLIARLGAEPLLLPPLRDHIEDLGALVGHFLKGCNRRFEARALQALCLHHWPGNVRELEKAIAEARVLSRGQGTIELEHLPRGIAGRRRHPSEGIVA